jgi:hypothetical protein
MGVLNEKRAEPRRIHAFGGSSFNRIIDYREFFFERHSEG